MPIAVVPALPVLFPATAVAIAASLWWLHRQGRLTALRAAVGVAACVYGAGVLGHVLFPFRIDLHDQLPWRVWVHLSPLVDAAQDPIGLILNVVLFVPMGVLVPLVCRGASMRRVVVVGLLTSLAIETVQLVGDLTVSPGRVADIDDLIGNTIGTMIGFALYSLVVAISVARRAHHQRVGHRRHGSQAEQTACS